MILLKSLYGTTNSGKLFADELTEWLPETGFTKYKFQMSIHYKYAPDEIIFLFYLILMTVYIGIITKILKNGLLMI